MVNLVNVLIVEDEVLIAQDLSEILYDVGYKSIHKARSYKQAIDHLQNNTIDFALIDINLNDKNDGIQLATFINHNYQIPFIYITSYSDVQTIAEVKITKPSGFLLKPYNKDLLIVSIELALFNYVNQKVALQTISLSNNAQNDDVGLVINNQILLKDNYQYIKIDIHEIWWFESDKNYIIVKTESKKYMIRCTLKKLIEQLPATLFVKCYKQYIINVQHVQSFSADSANIYGNQIPISRNTQEEVMQLLKR